jgi:hypothetical protein
MYVHLLTLLSSFIYSWEQEHSFSFHVALMPAKLKLKKNLTISMFSSVRELAQGTNAVLSLADHDGETVVIKMIKDGVKNDLVRLCIATIYIIQYTSTTLTILCLGSTSRTRR